MNKSQKTAQRIALVLIFSLLAALTPVFFGSEMTVYAADSDFEITNGVVENYSGKGGKITVPSKATAIGDEAFYGCGNITSITIPSSVKTIGQRARSTAARA